MSVSELHNVVCTENIVTKESKTMDGLTRTYMTKCFTGPCLHTHTHERIINVRHRRVCGCWGNGHVAGETHSPWIFLLAGKKKVREGLHRKSGSQARMVRVLEVWLYRVGPRKLNWGIG